MLVLVLAFFSAAADGEADRPKHPPEIEALVDQARGIAPEFSADILLRLAESPAVKDPVWRRVTCWMP